MSQDTFWTMRASVNSAGWSLPGTRYTVLEWVSLSATYLWVEGRERERRKVRVKQ